MSLFAGPSTNAQQTVRVTYRHLLSSQAMNVFNPLRTIGHCDIDGAFAQFEQVRLGLPDDVPLICIQWNSIIAVNYPARAYGIKRFTSIADAKKQCPNLVVQHVATYREGESEAGYWDDVDRRTHKVSLDPYRRESLKILAVFREMAPEGELEKASIDEAFVDLTQMVIDRLLVLHPYLATVPEDAPEGLDSPLPPAPAIDWSRAGNMIPVPDTDRSEEADEEHEDCPTRDDTWEDWALCVGAEIMADLRAEVWKRLHYTCSAGIAHNKSLAKLCSAWKKPNAQTVLRQAAVPAFLRDMEFTEIRFLGGKLGGAIAEEFGVKTVGDLLTVSLEDMQAKFGEDSIWVYNIIRGIDHTEVKEKLANKSMLASKNTIPNVRTKEQGYHWLSVLSGDLNVRLHEARDVAPGLWPKTLVLSTRSQNEATRSRQIPFPFTRSLTPDYILKYARRLWDEHTQPLDKGTMKLSNISLAFSGLEKLEQGQRGIEGFFSAGKVEKRHEREVGAEADPQPKRRRTTPASEKPKPTGLESFLVRGRSTSGSRETTPVVLESPAYTNSSAAPEGEARRSSEDAVPGSPDVVPVDEPPGWRCPKCGQRFTPPVHAESEPWLASAKLEHDDYHFALSLQAEDGDRSGSGSRSGSAGGSRSGSASGANGAGTPRARREGAKGAGAKKKGIMAFLVKKT